MNERLKDLASQAGQEAALNNFVELIVKSIISDVQCFSSNSIDCGDQWVETEGEIAYNQAVEDIVDHIRRNFL